MIWAANVKYRPRVSEEKSHYQPDRKCLMMLVVGTARAGLQNQAHEPPNSLHCAQKGAQGLLSALA
jgi:hypothetical protein